MTEYLNGFTIISFNHKNKYITLKAENYFFNKEKNNEEGSVNNSQSSNNILGNHLGLGLALPVNNGTSNNMNYYIIYNQDTNSYEIISINYNQEIHDFFARSF